MKVNPMRVYRSKPGPFRPADDDTPWTYQPQFAHIAHVLCQDGATDLKLARVFKVTVSTINKWRREHKDFSKACKAGNNFANEAVERGLAERAIGYNYAAVKVMHYKGRVIVVPHEKHVPPDPKAAMFWLVNRMPDKWSFNPKPKQLAQPESDWTRLFREMNFNTIRPKEN